MGKVKSIVKYKVLIGKDDEILAEFKNSLQEFDSAGNLVKEVQYDREGEIDIANAYKYDDKNRLIEEIHYYEEETGERIRYSLDDRGRRTAVQTEYADGSTSNKSFHRNGNLLTVESLDEDGDLESKETIRTDEQGRVLEEARYDEDGALVVKFVNGYDAKGQLVNRKEYVENDELVKKILLEYDHAGNAVQETHLNRRDEVIDNIKFTYDAKGNRTSWQNSVYHQQTVYDKEGRPVREERRNRRNNLVEELTEYTYDEEGKISSEKSFSMGEEYELEPGAVTRTRSDFIVHRYAYEYFDE
jgi:YD repeat-containing protein